MILLGRACWAITKSLQIETSNSQIKLSWYQLIFGPGRRSWYMFLLVIEMYFLWGTDWVDGIPWREASNKQSNIHILLCINRDGRLSGWSVEWAFISLRVEENGKRMTDDCQDLMRLGEERLPFDNGVSTELWSGPASLSCQRAPTDTKKLTVKRKYIAVQIYRSANFWQKRQTFQVASFVCVCINVVR